MPIIHKSLFKAYIYNTEIPCKAQQITYLIQWCHKNTLLFLLLPIFGNCKQIYPNVYIIGLIFINNLLYNISQNIYPTQSRSKTYVNNKL